MIFIKNLRLFLLVMLIMTSGSLQANSFQDVNNVVRSQLVNNGFSANAYNPNASSASSLRNYLANSCIFHRKVTSYDSYNEAFKFYSDGRFTYKNSSSFTGSSPSGFFSGRGTGPTKYGKWNSYLDNYNRTIVFLNTDAGSSFIMFLNSYDSGAISFIHSSGSRLIYRKFPVNGCG